MPETERLFDREDDDFQKQGNDTHINEGAHEDYDMLPGVINISTAAEDAGKLGIQLEEYLEG